MFVEQIFDEQIASLVTTVLETEVACVQLETGSSGPYVSAWIVHLLSLSLLSNSELQLHFAGWMLRSTRRVGERRLRITPRIHSYTNQTPIKVGVVQRTIQVGNKGDVHFLPENRIPVAGRKERVGLDTLSRVHSRNALSHSRLV